MTEEGMKEDQLRILQNVRNTELKLDMVLMEKEFTIGELVELNPGSMLFFEVPITEDCHVSVNGRPFARGKTVQVGENYGFEVKALL